MRIISLLLSCVLPGLLWAMPLIAGSEELHLVINGRSWHLDNDRDWNENNYGPGFEYDFVPRRNWIPLASGGSFKDSNRQTSNYLGGGAKRRFGFGPDRWHMHFDAGLLGFVMTRKDYRNEQPFLGVLPFVSIGTERYALNVTYIPKIHPKSTELVYLQFMIRLGTF
jgi:hypothetical protein